MLMPNKKKPGALEQIMAAVGPSLTAAIAGDRAGDRAGTPASQPASPVIEPILPRPGGTGIDGLLAAAEVASRRPQMDEGALKRARRASMVGAGLGLAGLATGSPVFLAAAEGVTGAAAQRDAQVRADYMTAMRGFDDWLNDRHSEQERQRHAFGMEALRERNRIADDLRDQRGTLALEQERQANRLDVEDRRARLRQETAEYINGLDMTEAQKERLRAQLMNAETSRMNAETSRGRAEAARQSLETLTPEEVAANLDDYQKMLTEGVQDFNSMGVEYTRPLRTSERKAVLEQIARLRRVQQQARDAAGGSPTGTPGSAVGGAVGATGNPIDDLLKEFEDL